MLFKSISIPALFTIGFTAFLATAATGLNLKEAALKLVPESKLLKEDGDEFDLQTAKGTIVEVKMNRDGSIDEVSGDAALNGDVFLPGNEFINLADAIKALQKAGKTPSGDWSFEKSMVSGWVYEFEGVENGKQTEYKIDAKNGKLLRSLP